MDEQNSGFRVPPRDPDWGKDAPPRVEVTRTMVGLCHMQVCAVVGATDEEILAVCNRENPSGTSLGWSRVIRANEEWLGEVGGGPIQCEKHADRQHYLVAC